MHRRTFLAGSVAAISAMLFCPPRSQALETDAVVTRLAALERRHGGRLGVTVLDTGNGQRMTHRGDERFLMCSTFKVLAVAAMLARVDHGVERMDRRVQFGKDAVLSYAPVTREHIGAPGMTVSELCAAAITVSDNTAANLLLKLLGGPPAVTAFVRGLGDPATRLDRIEPELNVGSPGDIRDTTTPNAMLDTLHALLLGDVLSDAARAQLTNWMLACTTGTTKIRAGVPANWRVGDKTGSGSHGESNDVAVLWPPRRKALLVTAFYADSSADAAQASAVLADVGRIVASLSVHLRA